MSSISQRVEHKMVVGEKFSSFDELEAFRLEYEQASKQKFWIRSSHQTKSVNVKRFLSEKLLYYDIMYACIHGGLKFKARGRGERQTSTHKMDCPCYIKILASACGNFLEIKSVDLQHCNHDLSSKAFEHLPQNRKLAPCERAEAEALLSLGCNKKKLQNKIARETCKHPTLKDLTNIRSALKKGDENDLAKAVNLLEKQYQATVTVFRDSDNHFKGLYFSTQDMRNSMSSWPEIVFIDGTYKLLELDFTLMLLIVEDSNGLTEVAGVSLIVHEDRETFEWFLECFKRENEVACTKINCFMADKDLLERNVLKEVFGVPVYICLFHTLKTFSRQITASRMGASTAMTRQEVLKLLETLTYSSSDADYDAIYQEFCEKVPEGVLTYYNDNWHPIRKEWTVFNMVHGNLKNLTNNRLESMNHKIKQVIMKRSTLRGFIENFFEWQNSHQYERDHVAVQHVLKRPVTVYAPETCEYRYLNFLTSYAFQHVIESIQKSKLINGEDVDVDTNGETFRMKCSQGTILTTLTSCQCSFFTSMLLPCKHIFAIRKLQNHPLFDTNLIYSRWTKVYYLQKQRTFQDETNILTEWTGPASVVSAPKPQRALTLTEKRKRASLIASSLVSLASLSSSHLFLLKLQVLKDIERIWRSGFEVTVEKVEMRSSFSNASSTPADSEDESIPTPYSHCRPLQTVSKTRSSSSIASSTPADSEDESIPTPYSHCRPLQTVSKTRSSSSIASSTPADFEDQSILPKPYRHPRPLQIVPETSEDINEFDVSSLDSELISKILDWETELNLTDLTEALRLSSSYPKNTLLDIEGVITPPPEPLLVTPQVVSTNTNFAVCDSSTPISHSAIPSNKIAEVTPVAAVKGHEVILPTDVEPAETSNLIHNIPCSSHDSDSLNDIIMPASVRVRGRPKGAMLTAIGLKRTRKANLRSESLRTGKSTTTPIQFSKRLIKDRVEIILRWIVSEDIIPAVLSGKCTVRESDVEVRPEHITNAILHKHVDLHLLQSYMQEDALDSLISTIETKRKKGEWECIVCTKKLTDKVITCDACLICYHYPCAGLKQAPRKSVWFCPTCDEK